MMATCHAVTEPGRGHGQRPPSRLRLASLRGAALVLLVTLSHCQSQHSQRKDIAVSEPTRPFNFSIAPLPQGDALSISITFTNTSSGPLVLNIRNGIGEAPNAGHLPAVPPTGQLYELTFVIVDEGNKPLPFMVDIKRVPLQASHFRSLAPKETYVEQLDLSRYFAVEPGRGYRVQAAYANGEEGTRFGVKAWTGIATSNTLVIQPR